MAFHFPLMPRLFMAIQMEDRFPIIDILAADAGDPRRLPVGAVPAQPRRADARDGHRRGARLHVPGLRARPRGPHQPGHPPPAGAAARERPPQDRADERPAVLAAGHAGHLLRRRDRHGRQHLPRRPQRRAHAHAVERRPQRRLLAGQPAAALPAGRSSTRSTTTRPSTSRRSRTTRSSLLWWMRRHDRPAQALRRVRPRQPRVPAPREPPACSPSCAATGTRAMLVVANLSRFAQYVELDLSRFKGVGAGRAVRPDPLPAHRRAALPAHARPARRSTGSRSRRRPRGRRRPRRATTSRPRSPRPGRSTRSSPGAPAASSSGRWPASCRRVAGSRARPAASGRSR